MKFSEALYTIDSALLNEKFVKAPEGLYEPIDYTLGNGGKRIRPSLVIMACDLFSGEIVDAIKPALGIEIFHNFTLLHDDIMDNAPIRRGKPTVQTKWNDNTAILSGDAMLIKAYQYIATTPAEYLEQVLDVFSRTGLLVCEGQQYDMDFECRNDVSVAEYMKMIELKTAVLLGAALKIGAIIGGAKRSDALNLYRFGTDIGLAFQLQDDLLDVFANQSEFGKKIGGDIVSNKKTFLLIHALEKAEGTTKAELNRWLAATEYEPAEKIAAITGIYTDLGLDSLSREVMNGYYQHAIETIRKICVEPESINDLIEVADLLMARTK